MPYEKFMEICNSKSAEIAETDHNQRHVLHSTNRLISNWRELGYLYRDAQGIKTGSTEEAGHCLVSSAVRGDRQLVSVVLGAEKITLADGKSTLTKSFSETIRLFDYGQILSKDRTWTVGERQMAVTNNAYFMHCLPVRRNMIVTDDVIESPQSIVIPEAANREISATVVLKRLLESL